MRLGDTALLARRASGGLLLALALAVACGEGERRVAEDSLPRSQTHTGSEPDGSTPSGSEPGGGDGSDPPLEELDAGPIQFRFVFDGSTTPTSQYVRGVDAAAGEAERGFADEDAGSDAGQ